MPPIIGTEMRCMTVIAVMAGLVTILWSTARAQKSLGLIEIDQLDDALFCCDGCDSDVDR